MAPAEFTNRPRQEPENGEQVMIVGFGAVGGAMRRRKRNVTTPIAYA